MDNQHISTLHKKGTSDERIYRGRDIWFYPTISSEWGVRIRDIFILDNMICKFIGYKQIGLIFSKDYDVCEFIALENEFEIYREGLF